MMKRNSVPLLLVAAAWSCFSLLACDPGASPSGPNADKPTAVEPQASEKPGNGHGHGPGDHGRPSERRDEPGRPLKGTFRTFDPVWVVSHFAERACNATLVAGASVHSKGNVAHLGLTHATATAAWDWAEPADGDFEPEGPTTGSSATVLDDYPYEFCSSHDTATGAVELVAANGDEVRGVVIGGEVYELGFDVRGDGQEQFTVVKIHGGTGRFKGARGRFVIHTIVNLANGKLVSSEILDGGTIRY